MFFRSSARHSSLAACLAVVLVIGPGAGLGQRDAVAAQPRQAIAPGALAPGADAIVEPSRLPGWDEDELTGLSVAIERQCKMSRPPQSWPALCAEFRKIPRESLRNWVERRFEAHPLTGDDGSMTGLITGYYEPLLTGSRRKRSDGQAAIYRKPSASLLAERPTRARIENDAVLSGFELVWLDDPVEAFFLQVQGSGTVRLADGGAMRVGYAGDNGHRYKAIGQVLIARGALTPAQVNAQSIKAWLRANPKEARDVMQRNPRYIFFREISGKVDDAGPVGSLGVPLTAGRSVAVDRSRIPDGSLLYLSTSDPVDGRPLRRLVVAQDTGGAIKGTVRADFFWGTGEQAGEAAGRMKQAGRIWRLVPRR